MGVANVVRDRLALVLVALVAGCGGPSEPTDGGPSEPTDGSTLDGGTLDGSALDGGALDGSAIDGSDPALNLAIIKLRNASSQSALTTRQGLGALDLASLQQAADVYRKLGMIDKPLRMTEVVATDLLPGR